MLPEARIDPAALDKLLAPFDSTDGPGYAVGVALRGRPLYRRGVGLASVELPVALSPTVRMRIGSTTKHFCCLGIMLLAEEGRLSADDSPRRFLPDLPSWADRITLRQMMAHTSGIRDSLDLILHSAGSGRTAPPDIQLRMMRRFDDVGFLPGEGWSYNNGAYQLLGEIVERVSGVAFGDFLRERILLPVGMHDTVLRPLDTDLLPNSATLHVHSPDGGWTRGVFGTAIGAEGGLVSTVDDMLRWLHHMAAPVVGTAETWAAMRSPLTTHGYGLGLFSQVYRGMSVVHHAGGVIGGSSQMFKVVDHDLDVVVMTNGRGAFELLDLVDGIIDACIPDLPPLAGPFDAEPDLQGTFYSPRTGRVLALVEQDGLQAIDFNGTVLKASRREDGSLSIRLPTTDISVRPIREWNKVASLDVVEFGVADRLERVEPPVVSASLASRYSSAAAGLSATVKTGETGIVTLHLEGELGGAESTLTSLAPGVWRAKGGAALPITFLIESTKDGFSLSTGRTSRLPFKRLA